MDPELEMKDHEILSMSDEDILKMAEAPAPKADVTDTPSDSGKETEEEEKPEGQEEATDAAGTDTTAKSDEGDDADGDEANGEQPGDSAPEGGKKPDADDGKEDKTASKEKPEEKKELDTGINYEAEYKRLLAPFKANGRDVSVASVDEAITLMQMGANYNKKMAALKPNLRLLKLLENQDLLSEEKISYLVDLHNKRPEAINKLVKDSGLNPMDFDAEKAGDYKPTPRKVDDREIELDTVLDSLQDSPAYPKLVNTITKEWDSESKQIIANNPGLLTVIDTHINSGIFDIITAEIERERVFGRLNGLSDIAAYRQVGDAINARGGFNHLTPKGGQGNTEAKQVVQPNPKKDEDDKLKEKRRAAGVTKPAAPAPKSASSEFNPLAMSDDEFAKAAAPKFR